VFLAFRTAVREGGLTPIAVFWYDDTSFNGSTSRRARERRRASRRRRSAVTGFIRARDVVRHPVLVVRGFGWRCFFRCLSAAAHRSRATFLDVALLS
jgi:hypothetical protein